jgi:hypothetical protein
VQGCERKPQTNALQELRRASALAWALRHIVSHLTGDTTYEPNTSAHEPHNKKRSEASVSVEPSLGRPAGRGGLFVWVSGRAIGSHSRFSRALVFNQLAKKDYKIWSATCGPNDVLYIPAECIVLESYASCDVYGVREVVLVNPRCSREWTHLTFLQIR